MLQIVHNSESGVTLIEQAKKTPVILVSVYQSAIERKEKNTGVHLSRNSPAVFGRIVFTTVQHTGMQFKSTWHIGCEEHMKQSPEKPNEMSKDFWLRRIIFLLVQCSLWC